MIIVIDDNKDITDLTCRLLNVMGYEATPALSGEEGIAKAKTRKPEIILCDIGMEGMNGYDVAEYIRRDDELKDTYLIAISGYSSPKDIKHSIKAGFNKHLVKPINLDTLKQILAEVYVSS
ncbi:MAG: response regulator [Natronincolaceae bacterium]|jgi:CheY-like chemotaxis protein|nr:response regulator [Bacillota bacterium]NLK91342.1 response regulator [Clostridiales bacterium]